VTGSIRIAMLDSVYKALSKAKTPKVFHRRGSGRLENIEDPDGGPDWMLSFPEFPGNMLQLIRIKGNSFEFAYLPFIVTSDSISKSGITEALRALDLMIQAERRK